LKRVPGGAVTGLSSTTLSSEPLESSTISMMSEPLASAGL
jgi:hypothetical protein